MMTSYKGQSKEWARAYKRVSKMTGFLVEELAGKSLILIKDRKSRHYGSIGVVVDSNRTLERQEFGVRLGPRSRKIKLGYDLEIGNLSSLDKRVYNSPNVLLVLEQKYLMEKEPLFEAVS
jgi:hypothetical protein